MTSDRAHDGTGSATARFGRTLSTLRAVPAATSATTSASLHPAVAAEFGAQLSFHRAQAEDIRSRARDAAALRALLKKLRAQAEEVSSEYGRLGERTAGMNEAVAALLSHLYAEQRASIETMAVSGGDETSRPASFESSSLEADVSAALAHLELEGCGVSDAEPSSLADGVAKSAATPPVIRQRKRRSKEALMRAVAAYVQPSPASSRAVSPTQQQQQFKEISASDAANATLAVPPSAAESTLTSDDAGPSFDLEVLNYLLLVTHELQQHMVATCARTKREMSAELVDHLAEFTKGNLRDARDQSQVFFRAFAEYQSHVKGLNANVTQAAASQAERELEHAYQQQWTAATAATGSSVSPIPNTGASVAMLTPHMEAKHKLHQFKTSMSQTVNRLRGQDEQSEARKIQSGRAGVVETSERLNVIGDQCLAKFELADTALEITELPRILLSHVKSMRAIFEDGLRKCDALLSVTELENIDAMLFKRQKEQMEVLMHQQRLRKQLSDAAIKPRGDSSASKRVSSSVDERHTNRLSKALDAPAPMGAPPQPPLKSSISNDTSTTSASPAPPPKVEVTSGLPASATPERVRGSGSTGDFPPTLPGDDTKNMAPRMIVDCSAWAYPKLDHLGLASTETSLLRLLCDPEFELIRCLGGLDTSKISVAGYRHLVTVAKIHDGAGTALEFLKNILQHNDYAMIVRAARAGTWWTYPRHSLDTGDSIANSVLDASCSNTVTLVLFKQILALEAKYFLEKVIGGIGSELQTQLKSAGAADALDMKMVSALVMKLFKDISTNRGLLSSHTRQLGRWLASRASMLLPLAVHDADADLANRLLAVVFLHGMIIPALRAPHEWNIAMPWDMKYVYRLYGTTHRDHASAVSSRLQSGTSAIPDQIDRVLTAVARLAGEVIGFITGSATDTMPAACHDELSMSMTLAASALCDQCELSIRDFLTHIGQESRVASGGGDSTTGAPVDAIGVLMLSQELDVFLADHVASSEHRILHWIDTHSREESVRADDMRVIAKAVESAPLEFEDACEEFVNANETGEDVVDERLPSSGNLQATAKARLSMLSRSIASQLRKL